MTQSRWIVMLCVLGVLLGSSSRTDAGWFSSGDDLHEYQGADAGVLALSLGAYKEANYSVYKLIFRTREKTKTGRLTYNPRARPDYSNDYIAGAVRTYSLTPGDYEIYDLEIFYTNGFVQETFSSKEPFSIPFTIKPKQTIYLGEFRAMPMSRPSLLLLGLPVPAGAKFQLSDQSERDIPIARTQNSRVTNVEIKIPEPPNPLFERVPTNGRS
ncbi:MAG: hypothetical protein JO056_10430 [Alphaproteobacteria bacterium]|nr:hypothetical protein [Alphaproteobacteria bacterium]